MHTAYIHMLTIHTIHSYMHSYMHTVMSAYVCTHALLRPQVLSHSLLDVLPDHSGYIVDLAADCVAFRHKVPSIQLGRQLRAQSGSGGWRTGEFFPLQESYCFVFLYEFSFSAGDQNKPGASGIQKVFQSRQR